MNTLIVRPPHTPTIGIACVHVESVYQHVHVLQRVRNAGFRRGSQPQSIQRVARECDDAAPVVADPSQDGGQRQRLGERLTAAARHSIQPLLRIDQGNHLPDIHHDAALPLQRARRDAAGASKRAALKPQAGTPARSEPRRSEHHRVDSRANRIAADERPRRTSVIAAPLGVCRARPCLHQATPVPPVGAAKPACGIHTLATLLGSPSPS